MSGDLDWMLRMNTLAKGFGDGLKPELEALLLRDRIQASQGLTPIGTRQISAGEVSIPVSEARLEREGIVRLEDYRTEQTAQASLPKSAQKRMGHRTKVAVTRSLPHDTRARIETSR